MDSQQAEVKVYTSNTDSQNKSSSPSSPKVSVNSPMPSEVTQDNSQLSDATTIILSSPSQALEISSQETLEF